MRIFSCLSVMESYYLMKIVKPRHCARLLKSRLPLLQLVPTISQRVRISYLQLHIDISKFLAFDNINIFARACQELGIPANDCISPNMFEQNQVVLSISSDL